MPVVLPCPSCHRKLRVTDALLGAEVRCPTCGTVFRAPEVETAPTPDEDEDRPWERPGMRRDSEPHRGSSVLALGIVSLVCTPFNICCGVFGLIFGIAGLTTGIMAWVMGQRDLGKMSAGVMDRRGEG